MILINKIITQLKYNTIMDPIELWFIYNNIGLLPDQEEQLKLIVYSYILSASYLSFMRYII